MAYVNVKDWSVDQAIDWLKGLDGAVLQYTSSFLNNGVTGHHLLNLRSDDLDNLGVKSLGHQELILEAVELLRHFHFELEKENLQMLAFKVSSACTSLFRELLSENDNSWLQPQALSDVHNIVNTIKGLVCWLDQAPFKDDKDYIEFKDSLLTNALEMATNAHRGVFTEKPASSVRNTCEKIIKLTNKIIREVSDPMILQPACLDLATLKKKEQELGFFILPNNHAIHQIAEIKYGSPAHACTKIEEGDEIVQVNYQTVVGWERKNVVMLLRESPPDIVLTLKKRPRHTKVYGQIYVKPYRLPSKKRDDHHPYSRWNDNIPAPRLLPIHHLPPIPAPKTVMIEPPDLETELSSSDDSDQPDSPHNSSGRLYQLKPRPILQRRNTISGATPTNKRPYPLADQYWQIWKSEAASSAHSSSYNITNFDREQTNFLRDKSASCNLDLAPPRPSTVIGLSPNRPRKTYHSTKKKVNFCTELTNNNTLAVPKTEPSNLNEEKSLSANSLASLNNEAIGFIDEGRELTDRSSMVTSSDDQTNQNIATEEIKHVVKDSALVVKDSALSDVKIQDIIKKFDEASDADQKPKVFPRVHVKKPGHDGKKPAVPPRAATTRLRGVLDKSHSTPAYDLTEDNASVATPVAASETTTVDESEAYSETKYELGIPIIEAVNVSSMPVLDDRTTSAPTATTTLPLPTSTSAVVVTPEKPAQLIAEENVDELPPKPPPRTFGVPDLNKPAYPSDSPKPTNLINSAATPSIGVTVFEFPDTVNKTTSEVLPKAPIVNYCDSKTLSTPQKKTEPQTATTSADLENTTPVVVVVKNSPISELQKSTSETKISPTNSIVRAMMYSNKNKMGKKKHSIFAKRRKVSPSDLSPAEMQGFLFQRLRSKQNNQNVHWEKRWFVLMGSCLYGFKTKDDTRSACLIFLSGFTVALANEVKSRSNAFKVYHTGTVFYFSADDPETLQSWIDSITAATLNHDLKTSDTCLYSETDESDSEKSKKADEKSTPDSLKKFGSLKKFTKKDTSSSSTVQSSGSTSLDRKWFFNKSSSHSKHSLPVPTAQFRSYRKIRNNAPDSVTTGNFTSHVAFFSPRSSEVPQLQQSAQNVSVPNLTVDQESKRLSLKKPLNYIHASNPSLCNTISDFSIPSFTSKTYKQTPKHQNDNLAGFVTLEQLMIKQSEERKSNPYNRTEHEEDLLSYNLNLIKPDVVYGEVPIRPKEKLETEISTKKADQAESSTSSCFGKRSGSVKKQKESLNTGGKTSTYPKVVRGLESELNRSLPRTHKLPEMTVSHSQSDRNLNERDEMIYCPETISDIHFAQNKKTKVKKQSSFNGKKSTKVSDSTSKMKLKSATQYTPMALPLGQDQISKPQLAFELNLDEKSTKSSGKLKHIFSGKQGGDSKKDKAFLASPKLHRSIFRKNTPATSPEQHWPQGQAVAASSRCYSMENTSHQEHLPININPHADYPGLEYPPVFEPETYSLADPQSSLTILRKQGKMNNN